MTWLLPEKSAGVLARVWFGRRTPKRGRFAVLGGLSVSINQRIEIGDEGEVN